MAITKRTRFEILRRDEHTCRYCGATAPDVILEVDHVIPVALGGSDDPSNLVAACEDCNTGKGSTSPDEKIVSEVSEKAFALAEAFRAALLREAATLHLDTEFQQEFLSSWNSWEWADGEHLDLPSDWRDTISYWRKVGVPFEIIESAIDVTMRKQQVWKDHFRYMCGIIWRTLDRARQATTSDVAQPESEPEGLSLVECADSACEEMTVLLEGDEDVAYCPSCDWSNGWHAGWDASEHSAQQRAVKTDLVARHIDGLEG